jgi:Primase C terminal 1 (PriCT-1)
VVAAPSLHANGIRYAWENLEQTVAPAPEWLVERMTASGHGSGMSQAYGSAGSTYHDAPLSAELGLAKYQPTIEQGTRNDTLYRAGCSLRGQLAMSEAEITERLLMYNQCKCIPPLDEDEVIRIAMSACQHLPEMGSNRSMKRTERNPLYWFMFNVRDFFADQNIQMMSDSQLGWYLRLRASAWQNGGLLFMSTKIVRAWFIIALTR